MLIFFLGKVNVYAFICITSFDVMNLVVSDVFILCGVILRCLFTVDICFKLLGIKWMFLKLPGRETQLLMWK